MHPETSATSMPGRRVHAQLFALLEFPYGSGSSVAIFITMYLLRRHGFSIEQAGSAAAIALLPGTFYFLYAPVVDYFLRRRSWLLLAALATALLSMAAVVLSGSPHLDLIVTVLFAQAIAFMTISAATGGLMSTVLHRDEKARVGPWVQVGNLGGSAIGLALLLIALPRLQLVSLGLVAGALALPAAAVLWIKEPEAAPSHGFAEALRGIASAVRTTFLSRRNVPALLLLVLPVGTGTMSSLLNGLSHEYGAGTAQLAFANGWGGGLVTAAGALCALLFPTQWNRIVAYSLSAVFYGAVCIATGAGPLNATTLIAGTLAANFAQGVVWGIYTGLILQTMGSIEQHESSRYALLNSIGNLPIAYALWLGGMAAGRYGPHAAGLFDGACSLATGLVFLAWWWIWPGQVTDLNRPALHTEERAKA